MKTIMIIDDEIAILNQARSFLKDNNVEIMTANNSREALTLMEHNEGVDLILIDTPMPCSDKTAFFPLKPQAKLETGPVDDFLIKPFTKEQFINFVKKNID